MHSFKIIHLVTFFAPFQYEKVRESVITQVFFLLFFYFEWFEIVKFLFYLKISVILSLSLS